MEREPVPDEVSVNVRGVRVAGAKDFGDVWLGLVLWRMLGLDELFREVLPEGREKVRRDLLATGLAPHMARWFLLGVSEAAEQAFPRRESVPDIISPSP